MTSYLSVVVIGAAAGALFGVAFGAFASVFDGGPTAAQGIAESWGLVLHSGSGDRARLCPRTNRRRPAVGWRPPMTRPFG